jgi:cell division protein FtsB
MPIRVRILAVICILIIITIAFMVFYIQKRNTMKELDELFIESLSYHQYLEKKVNSLQTTLVALGTDSFIENQARTLYGYMKSDELRFVITNPEVLYGTQD